MIVNIISNGLKPIIKHPKPHTKLFTNRGYEHTNKGIYYIHKSEDSMRKL